MPSGITVLSGRRLHPVDGPQVHDVAGRDRAPVAVRAEQQQAAVAVDVFRHPRHRHPAGQLHPDLGAEAAQAAR